MDFIKGNNRDQLVFSILEMQIEPENPVRFADAFVEHLELDQLGFVVNTLKTDLSEQVSTTDLDARALFGQGQVVKTIMLKLLSIVL